MLQEIRVQVIDTATQKIMCRNHRRSAGLDDCFRWNLTAEKAVSADYLPLW